MENKQYSKKYFGLNPSRVLPTPEELDKSLPGFKKTLVSFIKDLPPDSKVLDAGCGKGKATRIILAYRPDIEIFAIDISDVQEFLPASDRVHFQIASVENVTEIFEDNYFDAIISQHVIEHLVTPIAMISGFKKVLKNQGLLYLETPNWTRSVFPFRPGYFWNDYTHLRIFTSQAFRRLFNDYNFSVRQLKTVSSSGFLVQDDSLFKVKKIYRQEKKEHTPFIRKVLKTILVRLTNPFLKDLLIGIAKNEK